MSVVILDFGSQYTQLIARRIRELGAFSIILPSGASPETIRGHDAEALVLSGGPGSVYDPSGPQPNAAVLDQGLPVLGICYGMHLLVQHAGGHVARIGRREYGRAALTAREGSLFTGVGTCPQVWMSHSDAVDRLPDGWHVIAATAENPVAAVASPDGRRLGLQFHPEVVHTPEGSAILANFLRGADVRRDWSPEHNLERLIEEVRERTGGAHVLAAVSGGVDSSALALLLARADVPHTAVFVDHGLLRLDERAEVEDALRPLGVRLEVVDASEQFLAALVGIEDPEEKRKVIGHEFVAVFEEVARRLGDVRFLAQGTLYPDVIESAGSEHAAVIKSHHNVGGLPERLGFELLEPFRDLFKDEVRDVARLLGLPDSLRLRHPFPGPGLAIRVLGEATPERVRILRRADALFIDALREGGVYQDVWQALAVLTPARSVGVIGDVRHYGYVLALRAVTSVDGMTADWARLPDALLEGIASSITRRIPEIGRVVYDITSKPPGTIEWE